MVEANANVIHRLKKMVRHKMKHNVSWCSKSQQERQAQAGENCGAKANAEYQADDRKSVVEKKSEDIRRRRSMTKNTKLMQEARRWLERRVWDKRTRTSFRGRRGWSGIR